eukprot:GHVN01035516.1.p1 GENE.GHVN01035516.1~~GHVN01035516.1.p1  ORF type:complete len:333 (+),score=46.66 GHVN01035516.1:1244-2242(+)
MDGFDDLTNVVVVGTTNRVNILDKALLRSGRFDRKVYVGLPDLETRNEIFNLYLKKLKLSRKLNMSALAHRLAGLTPGGCGADIKNVCNEAAVFAARRDSQVVEGTDFENAQTKVMVGADSGVEHSAKDMETVSYHEAGHAVVGWFLEHAMPPLKVTIVPRDTAGGFVQPSQNESEMKSRKNVEADIAMALGGRAAEDLTQDDITVGAISDFGYATKLARRYVINLGMSKIGFVPQGYLVSEATAKVIDQEVKATVANQHERAKSILREHMEELHKLAGALKEKKTLNYNEIAELIGERPAGWQLEARFRGRLDDSLEDSVGEAAESVSGYV